MVLALFVLVTLPARPNASSLTHPVPLRYVQADFRGASFWAHTLRNMQANGMTMSQRIQAQQAQQAQQQQHAQQVRTSARNSPTRLSP